MPSLQVQVCRHLCCLEGKSNATGVWHESVAEKQQLRRQPKTSAERRATSETVVQNCAPAYPQLQACSAVFVCLFSWDVGHQ